MGACGSGRRAPAEGEMPMAMTTVVTVTHEHSPTNKQSPKSKSANHTPANPHKSHSKTPTPQSTQRLSYSSALLAMSVPRRLDIEAILHPKIADSAQRARLDVKRLIKPICDSARRLTVVLDLDETLVSASDEKGPFPDGQEADFVCELPYKHKGELSKVWVRRRQWTMEFLQFLKEQDGLEIVLWTAGVRAYGCPIVDWLDPEGEVFDACLYREACTFLEGRPKKDLTLLGRPMSQLVVVDDSKEMKGQNPKNTILVTEFNGDGPDDDLLHVQALLRKLLEKPSLDVTKSNLSIPKRNKNNISLTPATEQLSEGESQGHTTNSQAHEQDAPPHHHRVPVSISSQLSFNPDEPSPINNSAALDSSLNTTTTTPAPRTSSYPRPPTRLPPSPSTFNPDESPQSKGPSPVHHQRLPSSGPGPSSRSKHSHQRMPSGLGGASGGRRSRLPSITNPDDSPRPSSHHLSPPQPQSRHRNHQLSQNTNTNTSVSLLASGLSDPAKQQLLDTDTSASTALSVAPPPSTTPAPLPAANKNGHSPVSPQRPDPAATQITPGQKQATPTAPTPATTLTTQLPAKPNNKLPTPPSSAVSLHQSLKAPDSPEITFSPQDEWF